MKKLTIPDHYKLHCKLMEKKGLNPVATLDGFRCRWKKIAVGGANYKEVMETPSQTVPRGTITIKSIRERLDRGGKINISLGHFGLLLRRGELDIKNFATKEEYEKIMKHKAGLLEIDKE